MILPSELNDKVNSLIREVGALKTKALREKLTEKYKSEADKSVIESKEESLVYALCRMPATYSVCHTLISDLAKQNFLVGISSAIDVGTGTGSAYFSLKSLLHLSNLTCYEKDENMSQIFSELSGERALKTDISREKITASADLVMASYVFSELSFEGKVFALKSMFGASEKYVLIVDAGTPKTYSDFMGLKSLAKDYGFKVTAPCMCSPCPLENDYCQFYARVERSSVLRSSKSATKPYEDEKYFYLLFEKTDVNPENKAFSRVIRRPVYRPNVVELTLCRSTGVKKCVFTKRNKETYKLAKKLKINEVTDKINEL